MYPYLWKWKKKWQVLQKALEVWDLEVVPLDAPAQEESMYDPAERETAFICHQEDHWFCIRKVNREWYNFNSLYPAPEHLSKFYLSAYIDSLKASGWTIFTVKGSSLFCSFNFFLLIIIIFLFFSFPVFSISIVCFYNSNLWPENIPHMCYFVKI